VDKEGPGRKISSSPTTSPQKKINGGKGVSVVGVDQYTMNTKIDQNNDN